MYGSLFRRTNTKRRKQGTSSVDTKKVEELVLLVMETEEYQKIIRLTIYINFKLCMIGVRATPPYAHEQMCAIVRDFIG